MSDLVSPSEIERIVGAERHPVAHIGRAVDAEARVYILHSERCRTQYPELRDCPYSRALDRGILRRQWEGFTDRPVKLWVSVASGRLVPDRLADTDTLDHADRSQG